MSLTSKRSLLKLTAAAVLAATGLAAQAQEPLKIGFVYVGPVGDAGCVVRIAGRTLEDVDDTLRDLLGFVPARLGDNPWARKW